MKHYDIQIRQGIDDLRFDMPIEEIVSLVGQPDEVETIDNIDDEPTTVLHYDGQMSLFCEGNNPTLVCIDISAPEATLFGQKIFDLSEKELVRLMVDHHYYEQDVDNEEWGERRVTFNEGNIDFYFDHDELLSVTFGKTPQ